MPDEEILPQIAPDYWIVEYEIESYRGLEVVTDRRPYRYVFTSEKSATDFATNHVTLWDYYETITFIGNHVVPLARIPF